MPDTDRFYINTFHQPTQPTSKEKRADDFKHIAMAGEIRALSALSPAAFAWLSNIPCFENRFNWFTPQVSQVHARWRDAVPNAVAVGHLWLPVRHQLPVMATLEALWGGTLHRWELLLPPGRCHRAERRQRGTAGASVGGPPRHQRLLSSVTPEWQGPAVDAFNRYAPLRNATAPLCVSRGRPSVCAVMRSVKRRRSCKLIRFVRCNAKSL